MTGDLSAVIVSSSRARDTLESFVSRQSAKTHTRTLSTLFHPIREKDIYARLTEKWCGVCRVCNQLAPVYSTKATLTDTVPSPRHAPRDHRHDARCHQHPRGHPRAVAASVAALDTGVCHA